MRQFFTPATCIPTSPEDQNGLYLVEEKPEAAEPFTVLHY